MLEQDFQKIFHCCTSHGWLTEDEARLLVAYVEKCPVGDIVEVGCYMGRSAMLLSQLGRMLHCVDPWDNSFSTDFGGDEIYRRCKENVLSVATSPVSFDRKRVEDWTPVPAAFVYLDGDHTEQGTRSQIIKTFQCNPAYIGVHDIADKGEGRIVREVAESLLGPALAIVGRLGIWRANS